MKKYIFSFLFFLLLCYPLFTVNEDIIFRIDQNHFYINFAFGFSVPIEPLSEIMQIGYNPTACWGYNLYFDWGLLGFGLLSGCNIESTSSSVKYIYDMFSLPLAVNIKYTTSFNLPVYAFIEANGGVAVNVISYKEEKVNNTMVFKPFINPACGLGLYFFPQFCISPFLSYIIILFDNPVYLAFCPGFRLEINF